MKNRLLVPLELSQVVLLLSVRPPYASTARFAVIATVVLPGEAVYVQPDGVKTTAPE
jgi:hypothetical protein